MGVRATANGPEFTTKGDANNVADDRPVSASQVQGEVCYHVSHIGTTRNFLLAPGALLILGGAVALIGAI